MDENTRQRDAVELRLLEELARSEERINNVNVIIANMSKVAETLTHAYTSHIDRLSGRIDRLHNEVKEMTELHHKSQEIILKQQEEIAQVNERYERLLAKVCSLHREAGATSVNIGAVNRE